jgi:UrcA family protein
MIWKQACLIVATAAACAGAAQAQPVRVSTDMTGMTVARVQTSDVDLSQDGGARTMWSRIQEAAHDVCGEAPAMIDLVETAAYRQCLTATETATVDKLGSARVAAVSHLPAVKLYASR